MRYFLITGEPSGDLHGSNLMLAIRKLDPGAEFRFLGGDLMEGVGNCRAVVHIREMAFMGFTQLLTRVWVIRRNFRICRQAIGDWNPHVVIPIDYGGFNLRMIRWLHRRGFSTAYYITPKVWAWMPGRAAGLARHTSLSLCILPFEEAFLHRYGATAEYVGNPVQAYVTPFREADHDDFRRELSPDGLPLIALLPGSRKQEITRMLGVMARVSDRFPDYRFVIAGHPQFSEEFYLSQLGGRLMKVVYGKTLELMGIADAAAVTSGTATLEAALMRTPQVVCYRTTLVSYLIARILIRVKYISLVNLILDRPCVEELIQGRCTPGNLAGSLQSLLADGDCRRAVLDGYSELEERIGNRNAPVTAAAAIVRLASQPR